MKRAILIVFVALVLCAGTSAGAPTPSLKGVRGLDVVMGDFPQAAEEFGLSKAAIKTDVEMRLRKVAFRVSSDEAAFLRVNVSVLKVREGSFAVATGLELKQIVHVDLNGVRVSATTWSAGGLSLASTPESVRDSIGDLVGQLISAVLEANPPQGK